MCKKKTLLFNTLYNRFAGMILSIQCVDMTLAGGRVHNVILVGVESQAGHWIASIPRLAYVRDMFARCCVIQLETTGLATQTMILLFIDGFRQSIQACSMITVG